MLSIDLSDRPFLQDIQHKGDAWMIAIIWPEIMVMVAVIWLAIEEK